MIAVIATVRTHPGKGGDYVAAFRRLRDIVVSNEPGTLFYDVVQSRNDPDVYRVIEIFEDQAAVDLHDKTEWLAKGLEEVKVSIAELDVQYHDTPD